MSRMSEEELESKVSRYEKRVEKTKKYFDDGEVPDARRPIAYYGSGNDAKRVAIYSVLLNDTTQAREWFEKSASYYLESIHEGREQRGVIEKSYWENEPLTFRNAMYCSILSGDQALRTDIATEALAMDDTYLTEFPTTVHDYYFVQALAAILLDRDDARQRVAHANANLDHLRPELHDYFESLTLIIKGVAKKDASTTTDGLDQLLAYHESDIQGTPKGAKELVCLPATALLVLARERGLDIEIESEYIPDRVTP